MTSDVPDDGGTAHGILRAVRELVFLIEALRVQVGRELGMSITEVTALGHIAYDGPHIAARIAERLQITPTSATAVVDRLESLDMVRRERHPTDRRKTLVTATASGHEAARRARRVTMAALESACADRDPEHNRLAHHFLADVVTHLRRQNDLAVPTGNGS